MADWVIKQFVGGQFYKEGATDTITHAGLFDTRVDQFSASKFSIVNNSDSSLVTRVVGTGFTRAADGTVNGGTIEKIDIYAYGGQIRLG